MDNPNSTKTGYNHDEKHLTDAIGLTKEELKNTSEVLKQAMKAADGRTSKIVENLENSTLTRRELCFILAQTSVTGIELVAMLVENGINPNDKRED